MPSRRRPSVNAMWIDKVAAEGFVELWKHRGTIVALSLRPGEAC